jgi:hypothetical protein
MSVENQKYDIDYFAGRHEWGKVVDDDKYWEDELLMDNFLVFYVHVFSYLELPAPSLAQLEMANFVSDKQNPHRMMMCLRGMSKSLTSQIYVVWRLLNDPDEHILVMSATGKRAENFTAFCQKLIRMVPILQPMKPRHNKERTSSTAFDVVGATISDSPSVYAVGVENAIAGFRATLVVYDDIESAQSASSAVQREKIDHYASEAANLLMSGRDESITLCTPHSQDSIYMEWVEKGHKPFIIPAEYPENADYYGDMLAPYLKKKIKALPQLAGTPVDERFPEEVLESKKLRIGKSQYRLQYLLDTSLSDELKYPLKLADLIVTDVDVDHAPTKITHSSMPDNRLNIKHNGFKTDRLYAPSFVSEDVREYEERVMAIDPSGRGSDELGFAIGFMSLGRLFTKEVGGLKGGYDNKTLTDLLTIAKHNKVETIVVESNFGDGMFVNILEPLIDSMGLNIRIEEVRAIKQKELRIITNLEPLMNQHKIIMDKSILDRDGNNGIIYSISYQMSHLTAEKGCLKHDDRIDALSLLCEYLIESFNVVESDILERESLEDLENVYNDLLGEFEGGMSNNFYSTF